MLSQIQLNRSQLSIEVLFPKTTIFRYSSVMHYSLRAEIQSAVEQSFLFSGNTLARQGTKIIKAILGLLLKVRFN